MLFSISTPGSMPGGSFETLCFNPADDFFLAPRDGQRPGLRHNPGRSILVSAGQDCESTILADYQDYNPQSWLLDPGGQDFKPARIVPHNPGRLPGTPGLSFIPGFIILAGQD